MKILQSSGFEYEKAMPTSPEDMFNESEVIYEHEGEQRALTVTYVRYFDTYLAENNIYDAEKTGVPFYEVAALLILMKNDGYVARKRLYYSDTDQFINAFDPKDIEQALDIFHSQAGKQKSQQENPSPGEENTPAGEENASADKEETTAG